MFTFDANNNLNVNSVAPATQPVSGTVTANQGTANATPWNENLTQVAGTTLGATAVTNFGTAPAAATVPGVNASLFIGTTVAVASSAGVQKVGISGATGNQMDAGVAASNAPTSGLATLSVSNTTAPAPTATQSVAIQSDYQGNVFVKPYRRGQTVSKQTHIAASVAATTILAAQAAGIFADISSLIMTVAPIATTAIDFTATLGDGTNNYIYNMNTGVTGTGTINQIVATFNPPLPATTAATAWTITLSSTAVLLFDITCVAVLQKAS